MTQSLFIFPDIFGCDLFFIEIITTLKLYPIHFFHFLFPGNLSVSVSLQLVSPALGVFGGRGL